MLDKISWAAGFLEGEGLFACYKNGIRVEAKQVNKEPLLRLQGIFGGSIKLVTRPEGSMSQDIWIWRACGDTARLTMHFCRPFMSELRGRQIDEALKKDRE